MLARLYRFGLGARVFIGNYTQSTQREPKPQRIITPSGAEIELYQPQGRVRKSVLLVAGIGLLGEEEPRLIRLARALSATGLRVALPVLQGLKALKVDYTDLTIVRDGLDLLLQSFAEPVCIVAFSAGGSIAMRLSTEPNFSPRVQALVLFSPIYDPPATFRIIEEVSRTPIQDPHNADDELWLHLVTAYRNQQRLGFTKTEAEHIADQLRRYSHGLTTAEKVAFHQQVIAAHPPNGHALLIEKDVLEAISPRGKMSASQIRLLVIHDAHDFVVPQSHMQALAAELDQRAHPNYRMLITPALSHVMIQKPHYLADIFKMIDMIGELFT